MLDVGCWRWALGVDYLVDDNMGHATERRVLLQHPQQHACCHEEQRGGRALLALAAHRVADGALADDLAALGGHTLRNGYRRDTPRLRMVVGE